MSMMLYNMFMPSPELCLLIEPNQIYSSPKQFVNLETRKMHLDVAERAAAGGMNVFVSECDPRDAFEASRQPGVYVFGGSADFGFDADVISEIRRQKLSHVSRRGLTQSSFSQMALPSVLAAPRYNGGTHKYVIDTPEQKATLLRFMERNASNASLLEARPFIETPSDRYTSYRLVYSAIGKLLAAGLLYSAPPDEMRILDYDDQFDESPLADLSNRYSPCYLGSRNVCSNVTLGGQVIPLMGEAPSVQDETAARVLGAHGIDPRRVTVPNKLLKAGDKVARIIGKRAGLVVGLDFLQTTTGSFLFLEANRGPGAETYATCWPGDIIDQGQTGKRRAMLSAAVDSIVATGEQPRELTYAAPLVGR